MSVDLKILKDEELLLSAERAAAAERSATVWLLHHLCEIQRRRLFAEAGCASLFEYCVRKLQMSEPQAARRVNAARLMKEFPEIEEKIETGALSISSASQAQTLFRREKLPDEQKREVLEKIVGQSSRQTEKILATYSSVKSKGTQIVVDAETVKNLERLKEIWSHEMPDADFAALVKKMAEYCCKKLDPMTKTLRRTASPTSELRKNRHIPAVIKYKIWQRDRGICTYIAPDGTRCNSRHKIQFDHIVPYARGGTHSTENLRLRCFAHNQWHAIKTFGPQRVLNTN